MSDTPELVLDLHAELGEGPLWDAARQQLLFVDILRSHVHAFDPKTGRDRIYPVGEPAGAVACTERGDWLVACGGGFVRLDPDSGRTTFVARAEPGPPATRMNDGYVDARGRFWAGTMAMDHAPNQGTLYRLDPDGTVTRMLAPVTISNGIDWSLDGRLMYYIDTRTDRIDVFDFDEAHGAISNRRPFAVFPPEHGRPDGLIVDAEGGVWVALWGGGAVHRYRPDGTLDRVFRFPASLTTKPGFGGPNLDELYVTSAMTALTPEQRAAETHAGGLFRLRPGVKGRPAHRFKG